MGGFKKNKWLKDLSKQLHMIGARDFLGWLYGPPKEVNQGIGVAMTSLYRAIKFVSFEMKTRVLHPSDNPTVEHMNDISSREVAIIELDHEIERHTHGEYATPTNTDNMSVLDEKLLNLYNQSELCNTIAEQYYPLDDKRMGKKAMKYLMKVIWTAHIFVANNFNHAELEYFTANESESESESDNYMDGESESDSDSVRSSDIDSDTDSEGESESVRSSDIKSDSDSDSDLSVQRVNNGPQKRQAGPWAL
jgi:hypothetical protein